MSTDGLTVYGRQVRRRRAAAGLTQQEAAERAGLGVTTWRMVEAGTTTARALTVAAIDRALGSAPDPSSAGCVCLDGLSAGDRLLVSVMIARLRDD